MTELRFLVPGPDKRGFLKREQARLIFLEEYGKIEEAKDKLPALIDYLVQYVTEPEDKEKAKELLWDAPQETIAELRRYFVYGLFPDEDSDDVPDPEKGDSAAG